MMLASAHFVEFLENNRDIHGEDMSDSWLGARQVGLGGRMSISDDKPFRERGNNHQDIGGRDEVYSKRVLAGKRTYFFDVKSTRSGEDFFVTITESKRVGDHRYEKHKIFLYKEDFGKFVSAMHEVVDHIKTELLPEYDFGDSDELAAEQGATEPEFVAD
jgi:hypothetical protein